MLIAVEIRQIAPTALDNILANARQAGMVVVSTKNVKRGIANARAIKDFGRPQPCESMGKQNWVTITESHLATVARRLTNTNLTKITPMHMSINGCLNHGARTDLSVSLIL